jgi:hypothetical protein
MNITSPCLQCIHKDNCPKSRLGRLVACTAYIGPAIVAAGNLYQQIYTAVHSAPFEKYLHKPMRTGPVEQDSL